MTRATFCLAALLALASATAQPSARPTDPSRGDTRLVVFGDFNGPYGAVTYPAPVARVIEAIVSTWRPDAVLFTGDVIAGQSRSLTASDLSDMWRAFDDAVAAPLRAAGVPYALTVGNHDASSLRSGGAYAFADDRATALAYWTDPVHLDGLELLDAAGLPFDYSFRVGGVFVVVVDASSAAVPQERRDWLAAQLTSDAARTAAARLVLGHLPLAPVSVGRDRPGEYVHEAEALGDMLREACASAYVSGHHAAYYPGTWRGLELLAAGGVGARRLLGHDGPARSTVTVIDVWNEPASIRYTTFDAATLEEVAGDTLPARLPSGVELSARAAAPGSLECAF